MRKMKQLWSEAIHVEGHFSELIQKRPIMLFLILAKLLNYWSNEA